MAAVGLAVLCCAVQCSAVKCVAKTSFLFVFFLVFSWFFPFFFSRMSFFFVENHRVGCACSVVCRVVSSELVRRLSWSNEDCDKDFFLQGARSPCGLSLGSRLSPDPNRNGKRKKKENEKDDGRSRCRLADGDAARAWLLSTKKEKRGNLS